MPIVNLTAPEDFDPTRALPRIAVVRKGAEQGTVKRKSDGKEVPMAGKDLDYFRVEFLPGYEWMRGAFDDMFPHPIKEFHKPIQLFGATVEQVFPTWMQEYNSSGTLLKQCDGETIHMHYVPEVAKWDHEPLPCEQEREPTCECKHRGTLFFRIRDFETEIGVEGIFALKTSSFHDLIGITNALRYVEMAMGKLYGIDFVLGRAPKTVTAPEFENKKPTGKRIKTTKNLIYIRTNERVEQLQAALESPHGFDDDTLALPENTVDVEVARQALGSGGLRRIGGNPERFNSLSREFVMQMIEKEFGYTVDGLEDLIEMNRQDFDAQKEETNANHAAYWLAQSSWLAQQKDGAF